MSQSDVVGIRLAEPEEFDEIARLVSDQAVHFDQEHWRRNLAAQGSFTYVLEQERIFGFVTAGSADLQDREVGEILGLFVSPEHRRQGWGRKLLVRGLSVLKRRTFSSALIYLFTQAGYAESLLRSLAFTPTEIERFGSGNPQQTRQIGYQRALDDYF